MIKPYYQGKLDAFCAIYSVLNALRLTIGIRSVKAKNIFNDTLLYLSNNKEQFEKFLTQDTDYINIVDMMLSLQQLSNPIIVEKPFFNKESVDKNFLWEIFDSWLPQNEAGNSNKAIIFRFFRYSSPEKPALNRHWTTADYVKEHEILHLFDCSHEAEAILNIDREKIVTNIKDIDYNHLIYIQPKSVRLLKIKC